MTRKLIEAVRDSWSQADVVFYPGVSDEILNEFSARNGVELPEDFRQFFKCMNGMPFDEFDEEMIRFWRLDEVQRVKESAPDYSSASYIREPETVFLFADYSLWSHAYAIRLYGWPHGRNEIVMIGAETPSVVASSFTEFLELYRNDTIQIF